MNDRVIKMAYEVYPKKNDEKPFEYNVPPIPDVGYDFKNEVNSSKNGVSYYVLEVGVISGAFACVTLTIFCHLTAPNKPVSNALFYSLRIPPKTSIKSFGSQEDGLITIDDDGNIKYTQTTTDIDKYDDPAGRDRDYGVAAQTVYWVHK